MGAFPIFQFEDSHGLSRARRPVPCVTVFLKSFAVVQQFPGLRLAFRFFVAQINISNSILNTSNEIDLIFRLYRRIDRFYPQKTFDRLSRLRLQ